MRLPNADYADTRYRRSHRRRRHRQRHLVLGIERLKVHLKITGILVPVFLIEIGQPDSQHSAALRPDILAPVHYALVPTAVFAAPRWIYFLIELRGKLQPLPSFRQIRQDQCGLCDISQ